jgi:pilus assembly protein CpaB
VRPRAVLLIASILVALVGTGLVALYVQGADARAQQRAVGDGGLTPVLVVSRKVPPGTSATEISFDRKPFSDGSIPPDAVTDLREIAGKVSTTTLFAGTPLVRGMFTDQGASRGAEIELTGVAPGNVVVPVRVNGLDSLAEALSPGVDVTLFNTVDGRTTVVVPRIRVVRVTRNGSSVSGGRIDSLLVQASPSDAALITAANRAQSLDVGLPGSKAVVTKDVTAAVPVPHR